MRISDLMETGEQLDRFAAGSALITRCAKDVKPRAIEWLWPWYLPKGKVGILAGPAGTGKTTIAMAIASVATTGGRWPDGASAPVTNVLVYSFEDDPDDTLVPRLKVAGADLRRVHFLTGVIEPMPKKQKRLRAFNATADADNLSRFIREHSVGLVIIDPVISALGAFDSHKNAETRNALQPLADVARDTGACILGLAHFTKGSGGKEPLERVAGSLAFGALARVVLGAAKIKDESGAERRIFARVKSNIGPDDGGFVYEQEIVHLPADGICDVARTKWGELLQGSASDLLVETTSEEVEKSSALREAMAFLEQEIREAGAEGTPAKVLAASARDAGHAEVTIRRAADKLGVVKVKSSTIWRWTLPSQVDHRRPLMNMNTLSSMSNKKERGGEKGKDVVQGVQPAHAHQSSDMNNLPAEATDEYL